MRQADTFANAIMQDKHCKQAQINAINHAAGVKRSQTIKINQYQSNCYPGMGKAILLRVKTIRNTMRNDDREPYTVGPDRVKVVGTRMAARYAYDRGLLVMDIEGARYGAALECVTWGRPILIRG